MEFCHLKKFVFSRKARTEFTEELDGDLVVSGVLDHLYTKMMEKNLINIIMPFERVQVDFNIFYYQSQNKRVRRIVFIEPYSIYIEITNIFRSNNLKEY